jgi:hypothetical protein
LPTDYKYFINTYGTGRICDFLYVFNPFSANRYVSLVRQMAMQLGALRGIKDEFGLDVVPYPLYFEPGGLLPCGLTDNGDGLYWLTSGENPDKWTVVVGEARGPDWEEYSTDLTGFLAKLLSGELRSNIFPNSLLPCPALFQQMPIDSDGD